MDSHYLPVDPQRQGKLGCLGFLVEISNSLVLFWDIEDLCDLMSYHCEPSCEFNKRKLQDQRLSLEIEQISTLFNKSPWPCRPAVCKNLHASSTLGNIPKIHHECE